MGCAPPERHWSLLVASDATKLEVVGRDLRPDGRAAVDGDEAVGTDRDDHAYVCVVNWVVPCHIGAIIGVFNWL